MYSPPRLLLVACLALAPLALAAQPTLASVVAPHLHSGTAPSEALRSEALLAGWTTGDGAATVAAFAPELRADAVPFVRHLVRTLTRRYGPITSVAEESTLGLPEARTAVVVRVRFERGEERLRLVWTAGDAPLLRSIARAASADGEPVADLAACAR